MLLLLAALAHAVPSSPSTAPHLTGDATADGDDDDHRYVVFVGTPDGGSCSGVVIAPEVVLVGGPCGHRLKGAGARVLVGPDVDPDALERGVAVKRVLDAPSWPDPSFPAPSLLVLDAALDVAPVPIRAAPLAEDDAVGEPITLVGYGVTVDGGTDVGTRRALDTTIGLLDPAWIFTPPGDGACDGDEGGAVLLDGPDGPRLVAVIAGHVGTAGPTAACGEAVTYGARVDAMAGFLLDHGALTEAPVADTDDTDDTDAGDTDDGGCGCDTGGVPSAALAALALALRRRRRR